VYRLSKNRRFYVLAILAVTAFYSTICMAVDLFHTDRCCKSPFEPFSKNDLTEDEACPACLFHAGCHSTQPPLAMPVPCVELLRLWSHATPESNHIISNEWISSITLRGPPSEAVC
jgi:hypothetical protein